MSSKMKSAPVFFVLAQVRFNRISALGNYAATIQDNLRKAGYPDYKKIQLTTVNFGLPATPDQVPVAQTSRHMFLNEAKTAGFMLDEGMLSFQTTDYDVFPAFLGAFIRGLAIVHDTLELDFSERVGIRFLDAVQPAAGEKVSDYFANSLTGMTDKLSDRQLKHAISETWSSRGDTTLMSRAVILNQPESGVATPPDLQPIALEFPQRFREISGIYGILDTDCWYEGRQKFDIAALKDRLGNLHAELRKAFNDMVTPHALRVWG